MHGAIQQNFSDTTSWSSTTITRMTGVGIVASMDKLDYKCLRRSSERKANSSVVMANRLPERNVLKILPTVSLLSINRNIGDWRNITSWQSTATNSIDSNG